jgi:uncharacterized protein
MEVIPSSATHESEMTVARNSMRAFLPGVADKLRHYVYRYVDPTNDETFYVGKGIGDRVFSHLNEAQAGYGEKVERIRRIWAQGRDVRLVIHRHGLQSDEQSALVEAAVIDCFPNLHNLVAGHGSVVGGAQLMSDIVSTYEAQQATLDFNAVIIKINAEWAKRRTNRWSEVDADQLYNSTRAAWALNPFAHRFTRFAIAVANGVVRQVYQIDRWRPADVDAVGNRIEIPDRWLFEGTIAQEKAHLVGKIIDKSLSTQNPIRWIEAFNEASGEPVEIIGKVVRLRKPKAKSEDRAASRSKQLEKYHARNT